MLYFTKEPTQPKKVILSNAGEMEVVSISNTYLVSSANGLFKIAPRPDVLFSTVEIGAIWCLLTSTCSVRQR